MTEPTSHVELEIQRRIQAQRVKVQAAKQRRDDLAQARRRGLAGQRSRIAVNAPAVSGPLSVASEETQEPRRCRNTPGRGQPELGGQVDMADGTKPKLIPGTQVRDITGERFSRLTVVELAPRTGRGNARWVCQCDCGKQVTVKSNNLRTGNTKSCGCRARDVAGARFRRHGKTGTPAHKSWRGMFDRCDNPDNAMYINYGGRGIRICDRWTEPNGQGFANFLTDMGERPDGTSLDRIDVNGNYEPSNCRWATVKEQANNKRTSRWVTAFGQTLTIAEWADVTGVGAGVIRKRLNRGWSPGRSLTEDASPEFRASLDDIDGDSQLRLFGAAGSSRVSPSTKLKALTEAEQRQDDEQLGDDQDDEPDCFR